MICLRINAYSYWIRKIYIKYLFKICERFLFIVEIIFLNEVINMY